MAIAPLNKSNDDAIVFVAMDLHSCTKLLWELVGAAIESRTSLPPSRVVLSGTHTHSGPGNFYGNTLYGSVALTTLCNRNQTVHNRIFRNTAIQI
jgi:neutral ceramidase